MANALCVQSWKQDSVLLTDFSLLQRLKSCYKDASETPLKKNFFFFFSPCEVIYFWNKINSIQLHIKTQSRPSHHAKFVALYVCVNLPPLNERDFWSELIFDGIWALQSPQPPEQSYDWHIFSASGSSFGTAVHACPNGVKFPGAPCLWCACLWVWGRKRMRDLKDEIILFEFEGHS